MLADDGGTFFDENMEQSRLAQEDNDLQTLIENNIIPEDEELANTLYSMADDFEEDLDYDLSSSSGSSIEEQLPDDDLNLSNSEYRDMMGLMEQALDLDESTMGGSAMPPNKPNGLYRSTRRNELANDFKKGLDIVSDSSDSDEYVHDSDDDDDVLNYDVSPGPYENEEGTMVDYGSGTVVHKTVVTSKTPSADVPTSSNNNVPTRDVHKTKTSGDLPPKPRKRLKSKTLTETSPRLPLGDRPIRPMTSPVAIGSISLPQDKLSVFNTTILDRRIANMRERCISLLGLQVFDDAYHIISQIRFDDSWSKNYAVMKELGKIVPDKNNCMELEQLLYLEQEKHRTLQR